MSVPAALALAAEQAQPGRSCLHVDGAERETMCGNARPCGSHESTPSQGSSLRDRIAAVIARESNPDFLVLDALALAAAEDVIDVITFEDCIELAGLDEFETEVGGEFPRGITAYAKRSW